MLFADIEHQLITAFYRRFDSTSASEINSAAKALIEEAEQLLVSEGYGEPQQRQIVLYADVKYVGQTAPLTIPFREHPVTSEMLHEMSETYGTLHQATYGYRSDAEPMQFVLLKVLGRGIPEISRVPSRVKRAKERIVSRGTRSAYFGSELGWQDVQLLPRSALTSEPLQGPIIVEEYDTTTVVRPGWSARLDTWNNIVVERNEYGQ
jgi:N-methylhydantoinase A